MDLVSPHPFWLLKNGILRSYPSLDANARCDVVVLGGGISGAFVAEALTRAGLDVILLEKRDIGGGSTCASTALLSYELDIHLTDLIDSIGREMAEEIYRVSHASIGKIASLIEAHQIECGFSRKPSVYLGSQKKDAERLSKECAARRGIGIDVDELNEAEVRDRFSFARPAALVSAQSAQLDSHRLAHALIQIAEQRGARIFDRVEVKEVLPQKNDVRLTTESGFVVQATNVVFATGYESDAFLPKSVAKLRSTYALASEAVHAFPGWWQRCLIWETARPYLYLRTTDEGRVLVGGEDDRFHSPARRDRKVAAVAASLAARFREMFPAISLKVDYQWAGTFAETKDGLPYIGSVAKMPRCYFALGFGGNGVTFSHIAAEIIGDLLSGKVPPAARLFSFDR